MNKTVVYVLLGIFAFVLLSNPAVSTSWAPEASEIPFQVNHSDRIVIGTVKELHTGFESTDVVISVDEWLENPLPMNEITVRTEQGTNAFTAGAAEFSMGEKVLLMLNDEDVEKGRFKMAFMELGKHPVSDRNTVVEEVFEEEKAKAIEIARNDPKIKVMLPDDAEVLAVEKPSFIERKDVYDVIFRWNNSYGVYHDTITVNLTSENIEGAVSTRVKSLDEISSVPVMQGGKSLENQKAPLTEDEKSKAIEIAKNDPKVKESFPIDAEVIAVEVPSFAKDDKIYNVIFKHGEFHDIITVNLTSRKVENSVSSRGEYQPKVEDLPMPVFREDVIVYFKEMPLSLEEFASRYGGKLIFAKPDVKMAAIETEPIGKPAQTSQRTLDFIEKLLKDYYVETAFKDEFMFISRDREYSTEPKVMYPDDMKDEYVPNKVIVGFWRRPPSLEEFTSRHGGKLIYYEEVLMFAGFDVSNVSEFISKVSADPYVSSVHPDGIGRILGSVSGDLGSISGDSDVSKAPGFEAILAILILFSLVCIMRRGRTDG